MLKKLFLIIVFGFEISAYAQEEFLDAVPNEVIVKFKDSHTQYTILGKVASKAQVVSKKSWPEMNLHHFATKPGDKLQDVIARLKEDPSVEFAEPNYYVRASSSGTFSQSSANMKVTQSWSKLSDPKSIEDLPIVAIIDSGLDLSHSVYNSTDRVFINSEETPGNGIDDDGNGYVDDISGWNFVNQNSNVSDSTGHGTHVSGIVLGSTEDIVRFDSQRSPRIQILPLKFLNSNGVGKTSDAIEAVNYAIKMNVKVINNSWGGPSYSSTLHSVFNQAYTKGITIVAAAGNEASNNDAKAVYPAALDVPSLISVAASTEQDSYASFSNYGVNSVHVFAPGVGIYSTIPANQYGLSTGTSMAAPFVSGLAALLHAEAPNLSGYQVKEIIMNTGDAKAWFTSYVQSGRRINFDSAVVEAKNLVNEPNYQPNYTPSYSQGSRSLASTEDVAGGIGCGRVASLYKEAGDSLINKDKNKKLSFLFLLIPIFLLVYRKIKIIHFNQRKYERLNVDYQGHLITDSGYIYPVIVKDLSVGGAGVLISDFEPNVKIEKATLVILKFMLSTQKTQRFKGEVKRSNDNGFVGLEFEKV